MEYVYLDLGGCGMNGMIGKSDDWTKIFGLKHDVSPKIFGLKLEKSWISLGLYRFGMWTWGGLRPFADLYFCAILYHSHRLWC
jgi:hypothetical protein